MREIATAQHWQAALGKMKVLPSAVCKTAKICEIQSLKENDEILISEFSRGLIERIWLG